VTRVLRKVAAEQNNAKAVSAKAVARVLESRSRKPLVKGAHDLAVWAADRTSLKDVVATYRNWMDNDRTPTLARLEAVDERGFLAHEQPSNGSAPHSSAKSSGAALNIQDMGDLAATLRKQGM
jgi:uncharacterized protein (DUF885 family)